MDFRQWLENTHMPPKVVVVGQDIPNLFLHGTKRSAGKTIGKAPTPAHITTWRRKEGGMKDPRGAALFLAEPHRPGDALMFAQGFKGGGLFIVTLKPGSRLLDMTHEIGTMATNGAYFKMNHRPAITDEFIDWLTTRYSTAYGQEEARQKAVKNADLDSGTMNPYTWILQLIPFAKDKGYAGVRFEDEILITDQKFIDTIRPASKKEIQDAVSKQRT